MEKIVVVDQFVTSMRQTPLFIKNFQIQKI